MLVSVVACGEDDITPPADTSTNNNNDNNSNNNNDNNDNNQNKPSSDFVAWDTEGHHVYVSPKGLDSNDGLTEANSVKTIDRAMEIAKTFVGNEENLPIIISLDEGEYLSDKPVSVISGTANTPVIFTSRNGKAVITGGTKITSDKIKPCTDTWILDHIQSDEVKENLYEVDLSSYHFILTSLLNGLNQAPVTYDVVEFYRGDETLNYARWPNVGEVAPAMDAFNIGDLTGYELTRYLNFTDENGNFVTWEIAKSSSLRTAGKMNVFLSDETYEAVKDWDFENQDIHTKDWLSNNWDDLIHKVVKFTDVSDNPEHFNNMTFKAYFTLDRGGQYAGVPGDGTAPEIGNDNWRRFAFINALEAIDIDGEYYYDYGNEKMYVYFEDEESLDDFYISTNKTGVLNLSGVENVSFRNVDVRYTQNSLITISNSKNISFIDCTLSNAAVKCAKVSYSTDISFIGCYIYDFGCGALQFNSCNEPGNSEIVSANILVENCDIGFFSERDIAYSWAVSSSSTTGVTVRKCTIHDSLHGAIFWNLSVLLTYEYNELYNLITGSDDCGVFYNYMTGQTQLGIVARYNYIHDITSEWVYYGGELFYDDGYSTSYSIYGNLITNIPQRAGSKFRVFGKMKANEVYGNIIADVGDAVLFGANLGGGSGSDLVAGTMWRDLYSADSTSQYSEFATGIANYGFASGAWDDSPLATDETRNYTYKMWKYMRSEEFFYKMYGTAITKMQGLTRYADEDAYVQINEENIGDFAVIVKSGTEKGTHTFTKLADMFNFLYEKCGYKANNLSIPKDLNVEIHYYGGAVSDDLVVEQIMCPLFHYNETEEKWELSPAAAHNGITGMDKFWKKGDNQHYYTSKMANWQFWAENTMNVSKYHSNFTFNMLLDFGYDPEYYNNNLTEKYNNYDYDIEGIYAIENGEYTVDFIDIFTSIKDMGYLQDCELLDLSTVGCNLKAK